MEEGISGDIKFEARGDGLGGGEGSNRTKDRMQDAGFRIYYPCSDL